MEIEKFDHYDKNYEKKHPIIIKHDSLDNMIKEKFLLGFEELFDRINSLKSNLSYPPYNIIRKDSHIILQIAIAGFSKEEVNLTLSGTELSVTAQKIQIEEVDYIYRGIANRSFTKTFLLFEGLEISSAEFSNGLLIIYICKPNLSKNVINIPIL